MHPDLDFDRDKIGAPKDSLTTRRRARCASPVLMPDERPGTPADKTNPATFVVRRGPAAGSNVNLCSASLRRREKIQARSMRLPMDADFFVPRNYAISPRLERRELAARAEGAIGTVHGTPGGTGRFYIRTALYVLQSIFN